MNRARKLLVVADGNAQIGLGHLKREADLIRTLRARSPWRTWLATGESSSEALEFFSAVVRDRVEVTPLADRRALSRVVRELEPDLVMVDLLNGRFDASCESLAGSPALSIGVGDWSEPRPCRTAMVLNANPCNVEPKRSLYAAAGMTALLGPDHFMAAPEFASLRQEGRAPAAATGPVRNILVALGGGDPANVAGRILSVLAPITGGRGIRLRVLPSPVSLFREANATAWSSAGVEFLPQTDQIAPLLGATDLLIAGHSNIAYESAILGVPMIAVNLVTCQHEQAEEMARLGAVVNAGMGERLDPQAFGRTVEHVLDDAGLRAAMVQRRQALVDGRGLERVITAIEQRVN